MMNDKVFLATAWDGLARAETNSQDDWTVERVIEGQRINCLAADPGQPDIWYFSSSPGFSWSKFRPQGHVEGDARNCIFRWSGDGPWEKLEGGLPQPLDYLAYSLATDPAAPGHLYAGLSNGDVWHSAEYGDRWQQLPFNLGSIHRSMIMI